MTDQKKVVVLGAGIGGLSAGYFLARTAYFDHVFKSACEENIPQIVFLGAGYDTRACRYKDIIKSTRIFELDILPTQQHKKEILHKNNDR